MRKKNKFRAGLFFGAAITVFFIAKDLLTEDMQSSNQIIKSIIAAVTGGAIAGILFGWAMELLSTQKW